MEFTFKSLFHQKKAISPDSEYERICLYCEHAFKKETPSGEVLVCRARKAYVKPGAHCTRFSYDLLKREPRRMMKMPTIDPEALED